MEKIPRPGVSAPTQRSIGTVQSLRPQREMNGDGDEGKTKSQIGITEVDESPARGVNPDQDGIKIERRVDTFAPFALQIEMKDVR